jgi:hypothetical protein
MSNTKRRQEEKKVAPDQELEAWVKIIYDPSDISDDVLMDYYDAFRYHGFDRQNVLKLMKEKLVSKDIVVQAVIVCALRGPKAASIIKLKNGKTLSEMGVPASGQQKTDNLSCARITAATADLAAYFLKRLNVPKRLISSSCPAWLQFPSAGSISLPQNIRDQHVEFSQKFSPLIKGTFNESIYGAMVANAYLDERLGLF